MSELEKFFLAVKRCPIHHDYYAVHFYGERDAGVRLTTSKCCGRWNDVCNWEVDPQKLLDAINEELRRDV
jgi:hypothetical protein